MGFFCLLASLLGLFRSEICAYPCLMFKKESYRVGETTGMETKPEPNDEDMEIQRHTDIGT